MNLFVFLPLAFLFGCLALLSLVAFLGVVALAGVLHVLWAIRSALGIAGARFSRSKPRPVVRAGRRSSPLGLY